jgi:hypothetical protein
MFRIYVMKAESLPAGDITGNSDPFVVVTHTARGGRTYRLGQTQVISNTLNPVWDANRKIPFDFPFTKATDSAVMFEILDHDRFGDPTPLGFLSVHLNEVPLHKDLSYKITPSKPGRENPMLWIWVDTGFEKMSKARTQLKKYNFFYVYVQFPRGSPRGSSAELMIYQCDESDGGVSHVITATSPQDGRVEPQIVKGAVNSAGCDQLFRFEVAELSQQSIFLPLIKIESYGGDFIITFAILAYNEWPGLEKDEKGLWLYDRCKFDPAINLKPCMQFIDQVRLGAPLPGETYSSPYAFRFSPNDVVMRPVAVALQKGRPWIEYTRELRTILLPPDTKLWDHRCLEVEQIYSMDDLGQFHNRAAPEALRIRHQWTGRADFDLSLCALNGRSQCVGRVSFNDLTFFDGAIEHFPPFRENGNGLEDVAVRFSRIPKQVKLILVVLTSYRGDPLTGLVKVCDESDFFELLFLELNPSPPKPGLLFGIFARTQADGWDFLSSLMPMDATKPYTAHAGLKEFLRDSHYIQKLYKRHS